MQSWRGPGTPSEVSSGRVPPQSLSGTRVNNVAFESLQTALRGQEAAYSVLAKSPGPFQLGKGESSSWAVRLKDSIVSQAVVA